MWLAVAGGGRPVPVGSVSLPLGVVTLSERYGGDLVPAETYEAMIAEATALLLAFDTHHGIRRLVERGTVQMLGSSGTVTTPAGVFQTLPRYNRSAGDGSFLDFPAGRRVSRDLLTVDCAASAAHPCLGRPRARLGKR